MSKLENDKIWVCLYKNGTADWWKEDQGPPSWPYFEAFRVEEEIAQLRAELRQEEKRRLAMDAGLRELRAALAEEKHNAEKLRAELARVKEVFVEKKLPGCECHICGEPIEQRSLIHPTQTDSLLRPRRIYVGQISHGKGRYHSTCLVRAYEQLRAELHKARKENTILRGLVAKHIPECVYCGETNMGKCAHGFPGCSKADDIMDAECLADEQLRAELHKIQEKLALAWQEDREILQRSWYFCEHLKPAIERGEE